MKTIKAIDAEIGNTVCFKDARFNFVIEDIADGFIEGKPNNWHWVRFTHGNDTASSSYDADDLIWIVN
jgi:hypothetical protein